MNKFFKPLPALVVLAVAAFAFAQEKPRMLVLDLAPNGVSKEAAQSLTELLSIEISRGNLYEVISEGDMRSLLKTEAQKQLLGASESDEGLAKIAQAINAPFLLRGSVGKIGSAYNISLSLIEVEEVKAIRRVEQTLVGEQEALIGSIRAVALALTLEEKGVEKDISEDLIDKLKIARKEKTAFIAFSPGYEIPIGKVHDADDLMYLMPSFLTLKLEADIPIWRFLRFFADAGFSTTIKEQQRMQDKHLTQIYNLPDGEPSGSDLFVAATTVNYRAMKIPFNVGLKLVPEMGRFLPFFKAGLGLTFQQYKFSSYESAHLRKNSNAKSCAPPYEEYDDGCAIAIKGRLIDANGEHLDSISFIGLNFLAGAGFEMLITHNIGWRSDIVYNMVYALTSKERLNAIFRDDIAFPKDAPTKVAIIGDVFPIRRLQHGLNFSTGVIFYW